MTLVVGASAHGSPGVSTALQLVASQWQSTAAVPVVVEADATGGVLAARYELALSPGFVTLAESLRKFETPPLIDHAQRLPSGVACVPLSPSTTAASAQLRSAGQQLGPYLRQASHPVVVDAGLLLPDGKVLPAVTGADLLLWFVRPTREELLVLRHRLAECSQPETVAIVLVGATPYNADQVSDALGVPVLHTLPIDRRGAAAVNLGGDDRHLRRCALTRSCAHLASLIATQVAAQSPVASPGSSSVAPAAKAEGDERDYPPPAATDRVASLAPPDAFADGLASAAESAEDTDEDLDPDDYHEVEPLPEVVDLTRDDAPEEPVRAVRLSDPST